MKKRKLPLAVVRDSKRTAERRRAGTRRKTADRRPLRQLDGSIGDTFHRLWGQAHDGVYVNKDWQELQAKLEKKGIL